MAHSVDIAVVGGGIAGLAAAWTAHRAGLTVQLLETAEVAGGKIRSQRTDGYLIEHGPHSFLGGADALWRLLAELDMEGEVVAAQKPRWRFVYRGGRTRRMPVGPGSALVGDWLSFAGKLRALAEPLIPGGAQVDDDLATFVARRFGAEVAEGLAAPFVTGIYAGDSASLGARDAFPKFWEFERDHGSVIRGVFAQRRAAKVEQAQRAAAPTTPKRRGMFSLKDGMGALPDALALRMGERVRLNAKVTELTQREHGWQLNWSDTTSGEPHHLSAKFVVMATPPEAAHALLASHSATAEVPLARARTCPMAMVHIGGPTTSGGPRGFGALVARNEGVRALGMLLPTSLFPGRAPAHHGSTAVFFGGAQDPAALDLSDERLVELAVEARNQVFGSIAETDQPVTFQRVIRWPQAIVQYEKGHRARMADAVTALAVDAPGLLLAGAHLDGVSMSDAAQSGIDAAESLISRLNAALPASTTGAA